MIRPLGLVWQLTPRFSGGAKVCRSSRIPIQDHFFRMPQTPPQPTTQYRLAPDFSLPACEAWVGFSVPPPPEYRAKAVINKTPGAPTSMLLHASLPEISVC